MNWDSLNWNTLQIHLSASTLWVKIHRPAANNSINAELTRELLLALRLAEQEAAIRVVVLQGEPKVFCTGLDLKEFSESLADQPFEQDAALYYEVLMAIARSPKSIVSLVTGKVNAGGVGFVAASDLVIAGPNATFALSELLFDLLPACVLPFLIRRIGFQKAQQLALTTQPIDVKTAHQWGLVDEWGEEPEHLLRRRIPRLARLTSLAVGRLKAYMNDLWIIQDQTRDLAVGTITRLLSDPNTQEKIKRFVDEGVLPW